jgi:hypothetical protein
MFASGAFARLYWPSSLLRIVCVSCLAELGLYCERLFYPDSGEWTLEVVDWEHELYPYDAGAKPGHPFYRLDETWPPSMNEVWLRRGDGR